MMWNGSDWLSPIPHQSEPSSLLRAWSTTIALSDISYFTLTIVTTAGCYSFDPSTMLLNISHLTLTTLTTVAHLSQSRDCGKIGNIIVQLKKFFAFVEATATIAI